MDDLFLKLSWWFARLPFLGLEAVRIPWSLTLPRWARDAFNNLVIVIAALLLEDHAPAVGKVIVGLIVALHAFLLLAVLTWAGAWVLLKLNRRLGSTPEGAPPVTGRDMVRASGGPLGALSSLLWFVWGLFYLIDDRIHWVNRVALVVWAVYLVAGCLWTVASGLSRWVRSRRSVRDIP